jgi:hypothetical protein
MGMNINVKTAVVLATALVVGVGQPLSAQTHPADSFAESGEGPIARAAALELAKLEVSESFTPFDRADKASTADAPAPAPAAAARRSKRGAIGAVIGAAAGAVLGVGLAVNYATRQCGSSCSDEKALIWASLIGIPIGGGVAGYYIGKGTE